jgi:hypothetical protein
MTRIGKTREERISIRRRKTIEERRVKKQGFELKEKREKLEIGSKDSSCEMVRVRVR